MTRAMEHPHTSMNKPKFLKFDTLKFVNKLKKAGMKEKLAEAVIETLDETREFDMSQMATKMDIAELKGEIRHIASMQHWMMTIMVSGMAGGFAIAGYIINLLLKQKGL